MGDEKPVCLVTGASSGIGRGIALALREDGFRVVATARRASRLAELGLAAEDCIAGDLVDPAFQAGLKKRVFSRYGRCDWLFNCAGSLAVGSIGEIDIDRMTAMLRLNVEATFRLTYTFLKRFKQQGEGHVVNISSVLGTKVRPTAGAYAASKYALEALSEALRMELSGTNIRVSCIQPGLVMTELHDEWPVHPRESMAIHEPLEVDDVVAVVRFLISRPAHVRLPKIMILPRDHNI